MNQKPMRSKRRPWTRPASWQTSELAELFGRANTEGIHRAIQGLRTKYNREFYASELFKELNQIKPAEAH
jgi:hypothetical protein